ncbi:hypothetical protein VTL71DRAFT_9735 [Oculimacula yallundae]|uniref:Uncharacterized protein n=1 Tax=Oculimacula yallundae TaxID=86028 RepID=A0ABR4BRQ9_9HELO
MAAAIALSPKEAEPSPAIKGKGHELSSTQDEVCSENLQKAESQLGSEINEILLLKEMCSSGYVQEKRGALKNMIVWKNRYQRWWKVAKKALDHGSDGDTSTDEDSEEEIPARSKKPELSERHYYSCGRKSNGKRLELPSPNTHNLPFDTSENKYHQKLCKASISINNWFIDFIPSVSRSSISAIVHFDFCDFELAGLVPNNLSGFHTRVYKMSASIHLVESADSGPTTANLAAALYHSTGQLISDYEVLVKVFPLDNPEVDKLLNPAGITTVLELIKLKERVMMLRIAIAEAEKKSGGKHTDILHVSERKALSSEFLKQWNSLRQIKKILERDIAFKYPVGCSYKLLGEPGKSADAPVDPTTAGDVLLSQVTDSPKSKPQGSGIPSSLNDTRHKAGPAADIPVVDGLGQLSSRRSGRIRTPSKKASEQKELQQSAMIKGKDLTTPVSANPPSKPVHRKKRNFRGPASRIAHMILDPIDRPYCELCPEIKTPQQIWKDRWTGKWRDDDPEAFNKLCKEQSTSKSHTPEIFRGTMSIRIKRKNRGYRKGIMAAGASDKELAELQIPKLFYERRISDEPSDVESIDERKCDSSGLRNESETGLGELKDTGRPNKRARLS